MKRLSKRVLICSAVAALLTMALLFQNRHAAGAVADDGNPQAGALVSETPLVRGSLPSVVTIYGSVGGAGAARQAITAPVQAEISEVYVRDGAMVAAGAPLLQLRPTPATHASYAQAQAALQLAQDIAARTQSMVAGHLSTATQLLQVRNDAATAALNLAMLKLQGADGPHTLNAPFAALVTNVAALPGGMAAQGDTLMQLTRPGRLSLNAGSVPDKAALIQPGNPATLTPLGSGLVVTGAVTFRAAAVDPLNGEVAVEISLPPGQALLGQMFRADITVGQTTGYLVPHDAVLVDDAGTTYIVQNQHGTAKMIDIQVLESAAARDVITGPVIAGAPVVLAGNYQLNDGDALRVATGGPSSQNVPSQ